MKKQLTLTLMMLLVAASSSAVEVEIGGLWYEVLSKTKVAKVIQYKNNNKYSGDIVIPSTVEYNGDNYSVTSIGEYAFWCSGLTSITIPNSVTSIGDGAFRGCSGITSIVVEERNAVYDSRDNCNAIIKSEDNVLIVGCQNTNIPNSVTSIGGNAFRDCSGLTSVTIPNSVTSIGPYAFDNCSGITSVSIPNSVTSIGSEAFSGCSSLTSVTIPNSVTSIGDGAFYGCSGLTSVTIPNGVTSIGKSVFCGCCGLTSVTIPNGVTSIGSEAFRGCSGLTSVTIPNSVTSIGDGVFQLCSGLTSINFPDVLTSIGYSAFKGCSGLVSVTIPNSVMTIDDLAFEGCTNLYSAILPNGITSIQPGTFSECKNLVSIIIPEGVTSLKSESNYCGNYGCFSGCTSLVSVSLPQSLTTIENSIFSGCSSLTSITIPNSVTSIGGSAFSRCGLTSVTIPNSVTSIGGSAFGGCSGLTSVTIPSSVTSIGGGAFYGCRRLTSVTIGNGITTIPESAFMDCSGLTSLILPNQLSIIRANAFNGCSKLETLTIPASVEYIYQNAFSGCTSLTSINAQSTTPPFIYNNTFPNYKIPVNVPSGSRDAYTAHDIWGNFTTINDGNVYYQLSVTADNHGTVTYNNTAVKNTTKTFDVMEATSATLTLTPDEGYKLSTVTVNGTDKTADVVNGTLTISNVTANTTVNVTFGIAGEAETVTIGAAGMATFCSSKDLDFSEVEGLKAYTGAAFNRNTGALTMLEVKDVPAGTGLIVVGNAGTYNVPVSNGSFSVYANLLKGVSTATNLQQTADGYTNYILGSGAQGTGFYIVSAGGGTLAAGKAYLQIPTAAANSRSAISMEFVEGTTDISEHKAELTTEGYYTLSGQRTTSQPQKPGIYVKNGRKVVVK